MKPGKLPLLFFGIIFIAPLFIAWGIYYYAPQILPPPKTHGYLFQPAIPLLPPTSDQTWQLSLLAPPNTSSKEYTHKLTQSHTRLIHIKKMLNQHQHRVHVSPLSSSTALISLPPSPFDQQPHLLIIDPLGNAVLAYQLETLLDKPQGILHDIKHLLKTSQIG